MAVKLTCVDNASGHDGLRWRMGPDSESVDIIVGETPPGVGELVVAEPITPEACFSVTAYSGEDESAPASICAEIPEDLSGAVAGDRVTGGFYVGTLEVGGELWHIISSGNFISNRSFQPTGDLSNITTTRNDGVFNTDQLISDSQNAYPAAQECISYEADGVSDFYLGGIDEIIFAHDKLRGIAATGHDLLPADTLIWSSSKHSNTSQFSSINVVSERGDRFTETNIGRSSTLPRVCPIRRVPV